MLNASADWLYYPSRHGFTHPALSSIIRVFMQEAFLLWDTYGFPLDLTQVRIIFNLILPFLLWLTIFSPVNGGGKRLSG